MRKALGLDFGISPDCTMSGARGLVSEEPAPLAGISSLGSTVIKAGIVVTFFMHLKWSSTIVRFMAGAAIFWLLILFSLTLSDFVTRPWYRPSV